MGDSDFVENVLESAKESFEQKYELKKRGFNFDSLKERVAKVMGIEKDQVTAYGKSPQTVRARSLLCFWAHRKLGMSTVEIAQILNMSQPAISRSSQRGRKSKRRIGSS